MVIDAITRLTNFIVQYVFGKKYFTIFWKWEVQNSQVTKSSYKTQLSKITSHFELLIRKSFWSSSFELVTRFHKILNINSKVNFYFSTFELLTRNWKIKSHTSSCNSMVALLFSHIRVTNVNLINEKNSLNITVWMLVNP